MIYGGGRARRERLEQDLGAVAQRGVILPGEGDAAAPQRPEDFHLRGAGNGTFGCRSPADGPRFLTFVPVRRNDARVLVRAALQAVEAGASQVDER